MPRRQWLACDSSSRTLADPCHGTFTVTLGGKGQQTEHFANGQENGSWMPIYLYESIWTGQDGRLRIAYSNVAKLEREARVVQRPSR